MGIFGHTAAISDLLTRPRSTLCRATHKSCASCIANQLSGERPSAFDNRKALQRYLARAREDAAQDGGGDVELDGKLAAADAVGFEVDVGDELTGVGRMVLRHSVVILVIQYVNVAILELERESPVSVDGDRPAPRRRTFKGMETKAGDIVLAQGRAACGASRWSAELKTYPRAVPPIIFSISFWFTCHITMRCVISKENATNDEKSNVTHE